MRVLVLGANGMAGHVIAQTLMEKGHDVVPLARTSQVFDATVTLDVRDEAAITRLVSTGGFQLIINCVGLLVDASEERKSEAAYVNGYFPHLLSDLASDAEARLFHISTDCVFAGTRGEPYRDSDPYDGQRFYDRSKALGELNNERDLTLRMSIIGPELNATGTGLFNWFARQEKSIQGYRKSMWNGITTVALAEAIHRLTLHPGVGVLHLTPTEGVSKYSLLTLLGQVFNTDIRVEPVDGYVVDKRLEPTFGLPVDLPRYPVMLEEMREWIRRHSSLYPHYLHLNLSE